MGAQFVSLAVAYSLGLGNLRRKGVRQRPWLELRRLETESSYLEHQVRALRRVALQPVRVERDLLSGKGYYDIARARIQSADLERAVELLEPGINAEALQVAGAARGIACLWLDCGFWRRGTGVIRCGNAAEAEALHRSILDLELTCILSPGRRPAIEIDARSMPQLAHLVRPFVHRCMRHTLHPGSRHGSALL